MLCIERRDAYWPRGSKLDLTGRQVISTACAQPSSCKHRTALLPLLLCTMYAQLTLPPPPHLFVNSPALQAVDFNCAAVPAPSAGTASLAATPHVSWRTPRAPTCPHRGAA